MSGWSAPGIVGERPASVRGANRVGSLRWARGLHVAVVCLLASGWALAAPATAEGALPGEPEALAGGLVPELLILFGSAFLLAAAVGLVRFPDFYIRLHATTKLVTLGGIGIFGGAALAFAPVQATERVLLIAVFFFLTAPLSGYMIARAGYLRGLAPYWEDTSVDEWDALGSTTSSLPEADDAAPQTWGGLTGPGRPKS